MNLLKNHKAQWVVGLVASFLVLVLLSLPTSAQVVAPKISCVATLQGTTGTTVDVMVDTGGSEIDSVRMEMLYPSAALSNHNLTLGSDFDTPAPGGAVDLGDGNMLLIQTYGRSESIGATSGELKFATITFDWTGEGATIGFNEAGSGTGQGSLQFLVGDRVSLNVESCDVGEPTSVSFNEVGAFSSASVVTLLLVSTLLSLATGVTVVRRK